MPKTGRERLAEYRDKHGFKQYELAELLELAEAHLSQLLSGKRSPGLLIAVRIEDRTGIPVESWVPSRLGRSSRQTKSDKSPAGLAEVSRSEKPHGRS